MTGDLAEHTESLRRDPQGANPDGWRVDWADGPWPVKVYAGGVRTPLGRAGALDRLLLFTFGMTAVRFDPAGGMPSTPDNPTPTHLGERYAPRRPIPSGGSMYPTEAYVVDTEAGRVSHYDPYRHELVDLGRPAPRAALRAALGEPADAPLPPAVLLVANRFWKNAYKYGEFAARLGAVDTGVALGRAARVAEAAFGDIAVLVDLDAAAVEDLLGLDGRDEAVFAAVELGRRRDCPAEPPAERAAPPPVLERSRAVRRLPGLSALTEAARQPAEPVAVDRPAAVRGPLDLLDPGVMVRRGSHGRRFTGAPVRLADVEAVLLHAAEAAARLAAVSGGAVGAEAGLCCAVRRVEGLAPGWYRFDGALVPVAEDDPGPVLRRALFAESLNPELAAFTVHVTGPVDFAGGAAGYRARQLGVGAVVEAVCLAATAARLSGHAVLGFDVGPIDLAYALPADRGVHAQVCVGAVRPSTHWEVAVMPR
uniref:NocF n=1 Tax=Nocardia sp. ATCC 202099 TaxID=930400 RepID=E5DUH8_9NOCA|nr:NocF [Nocardia sp. ATCC 202099]